MEQLSGLGDDSWQQTTMTKLYSEEFLLSLNYQRHGLCSYTFQRIWLQSWPFQGV